jgi:hypothetical protein
MRDIYDSDIRAAVADTENEIFSEATGGEERTDQENQLVSDLSEVEGWDGSDLNMEEIAHRNLYGDTQTNYDRAIEMETEQTLQAENDILRQQINEQEGFIQQYLAQPLTAEARAQQRAAIRDRMEQVYGFTHFGSDQQVDAFINHVQTDATHAQNLESGRVGASLQHAANAYGADFHDAFSDLTSMDPRHPLARQIVQSVTASADPGQAVMQLHGNSLVRSLSTGNVPPFIPRHPGAPAHPRSAPSREGPWEAGWGDRATEEDILRSAWEVDSELFEEVMR